MDDEIYARMTGIFGDVFDDAAIEVTPHLTASDVREWDGLSHIRLLLVVQKAFQTRCSAA